MNFRDSHILPIIVLVLIVIMLGMYYYSKDRSTLVPGHDNQMIIPCAFKLIDPELYLKDNELKYVDKFNPVMSVYLWSYSYRIFGDSKKATYAIYVIYGSFLLIGIYFFCHTLFDNKIIAFTGALFSIASREVYCFVNMWGLRAIFDHPFARAIGAGLISWILILFLKFKDDKKILPLVFFVMGILSAIHNLSMAHLFIVLAMVLVFQVITNKRKITTLPLPILAFILGATPALIKFLKACGSGTPDMKEISIRAWYTGIPSLGEFLSVTLVDMFFPLAIGLLGFLMKRRKDYSSNDKGMLLIFISSFLFGLSILISVHFPKLIGLFTLRITRYFYIVSLPYAAYFVVSNLKSQSIKGIQKGIIVIIAIMLLSPSIYTSSLRKIGKRVYWEYIKKSQPPLKGVDLFVQRGDRLENTEDLKSFMEMCNWVKNNTPKTSHFLVPPVEFEFFRAHSQRGIVSSFKGRGWATFSAESAKQLGSLFNEVNGLYRNPRSDVDALISLAKREGADHIVIDKNRHKDREFWHLPFKPIFENKRFIVYRVSDYNGQSINK
ncbi:hypothetical protein KKB18_09690 [bacterium]|nr:hypothetical protein [bacterium]